MDGWLSALERRLGPRMPGNLTYVLVGLTAMSLAVGLVFPDLVDWLRLDPELVKRGQVWRLFTYVIVPATLSPGPALGSLYWLHQVGTRLEREWGAAKFALWWLVGGLATATTSVVFDVPGDTSALLLSLFLAYATLYPNEERMVMFVVPVQMKWLALLDVGVLLMMTQAMPGLRKLIPIVGISNYLLFFGPELVGYLRTYFRQGSRLGDWRRRRGPVSAGPEVRSCTVCGLSSDQREADIRVCNCEKCGKPTPFCVDHVKEH
ncbi:MAG: rhomboid family intramembrane serine protease [Polyangiaceae bacterium]